ncbi:MAG: hypothetical protein EHM13_14480, partial [Acidobacteria bacterium]
MKVIAAATVFSSLLLAARPVPAQQPGQQAQQAPGAAALFRPADGCMACHNGLTGPGGEDISIGMHWRPSVMANSARDPYWHAAVRREVVDHPEAQADI